jgi:cytochrome c oxidase cbb3-type subunit 3
MSSKIGCVGCGFSENVLMKKPVFSTLAPGALAIVVIPLMAGTLSSCAQTGPAPAVNIIPNGRTLFLKNCAHCHAADATGDEGPDLHGLDWSAGQIRKRILNGKKGQMTAFAGKLQPAQIDALIKYVQSLK